MTHSEPCQHLKPSWSGVFIPYYCWLQKVSSCVVLHVNLALEILYINLQISCLRSVYVWEMLFSQKPNMIKKKRVTTTTLGQGTLNRKQSIFWFTTRQILLWWYWIFQNFFWCIFYHNPLVLQRINFAVTTRYSRVTVCLFDVLPCTLHWPTNVHTSWWLGSEHTRVGAREGLWIPLPPPPPPSHNNSLTNAFH